MTKTEPEAKPQEPYTVVPGWSRWSVIMPVKGFVIAQFHYGKWEPFPLRDKDARRCAEEFAAKLNAEAAEREPDHD